ncbi:hypothetical protein P691DRAFT_785442 [Macrolepiota fuliginosa MF-IS2]|uniref:Uncharacterized protein n=1 Tax=Macrolepiota fuliginosa MF-IS2 TaxID=1400762 RepID=A0A9P5X748_9AGAR|nr:hypothetical protein P691DRAFT_785442 [Macrolepiota fuliginosa MF-IS2]
MASSFVTSDIPYNLWKTYYIVNSSSVNGFEPYHKKFGMYRQANGLVLMPYIYCADICLSLLLYWDYHGLTCGLAVISLKSVAVLVFVRSGKTSYSCTNISGKGEGASTPTLAGPLVLLFVDIVIMCMALWAMRRKYHDRDESNRLLRKIRRDTITFYCINFLNPGQAVVPLRVRSVLASILASTMILDLKDYGNHTLSFSQDLTAAYSTSELSTLRFNAHGSSQIDECSYLTYYPTTMPKGAVT